jgi:hypothetical protein
MLIPIDLIPLTRFLKNYLCYFRLKPLKLILTALMEYWFMLLFYETLATNSLIKFSNLPIISFLSNNAYPSHYIYMCSIYFEITLIGSP